MPKVGKKKFPYTAAGKKAAAKAKKGGKGKKASPFKKKGFVPFKKKSKKK